MTKQQREAKLKEELDHKLENTYAQMRVVNPGRLTSHPIEDFIVENFQDRLTAAGIHADDYTAKWFLDKRYKDDQTN